MSKEEKKNKIDEQEQNRLLEIERKYNKSMKRQRMYSRRRNARLVIMYHKAQEKGLVVTDEEIDDYLKNS